jgi:hypothetical protein
VSKQAIKDARKQIRLAYKAYRREVKKHKLFKRQASIKDTLAQMGVANRSISVMCYESGPYKVKVRVGV